MTLSKKLITSLIGISAATLLLSACGENAPAPSGTGAADPALTSAITDRQANFKKMGASMKVFKDQLASGTLSKPELVAAAKTIADAGRAQLDKFPAGSDASAGVKTGALPVIWSDRASFDKDLNSLIDAADKLAIVSETGDAKAIGDQFKIVGETCSTCHKQFRAKD